MNKKVVIFLAEGFEEVEAVTPIDYLRRVDIEVVSVSIGASVFVNGSHGIQLKADTTLAELEAENSLKPALWDAVILPGGMPGAVNLAASAELPAFLKSMAASNKWVCAICASPALVLAPLGLLKGKTFTCYPGLEEKVQGASCSGARTVVDKAPEGGGLITGKAAGATGEFAIAIIEQLIGKPEAKSLAAKVLLGQS